MTTLTKIIVSIILSLLLFSCEFGSGWMGVSGNGNVVTETRQTNDSFNEIQVSRGLDVYLTQSNIESVTVEADSNLQDIITVIVDHGVLKIKAEENISSSSAKKVHVNYKSINKLKASSGSDVYTTNTLTNDILELDLSSGSDAELDINAQTLVCSATSGSDIELTGKVMSFNADASSGSDIDAGDLLAEKSRVKASSGASISVNTSKELIAKANSGGDVTYYGNPERVEKSEGVSGGISQQ